MCKQSQQHNCRTVKFFFALFFNLIYCTSSTAVTNPANRHTKSELTCQLFISLTALQGSALIGSLNPLLHCDHLMASSQRAYCCCACCHKLIAAPEAMPCTWLYSTIPCDRHATPSVTSSCHNNTFVHVSPMKTYLPSCICLNWGTAWRGQCSRSAGVNWEEETGGTYIDGAYD